MMEFIRKWKALTALLFIRFNNRRKKRQKEGKTMSSNLLNERATKEKRQERPVQYSVLLYPSDVEKVTAKAKEQGLSFSSLIRELMAQYVKKGGKNGNNK